MNKVNIKVNKIITIIKKAFYIALYFILRILPLKDVIVFESEGDFTDNAQALYKYLMENNYFETFKPVWIVHNTEYIKEKYGVLTIPKDSWNSKRAYYLAVYKYYYFDHVDISPFGTKRKHQKKYYMPHGFAFKAINEKQLLCDRAKVNNIIECGPIPAKYANERWGGTPKQVTQWGYPRNDYLFKYSRVADIYVHSSFGFDRYNLVVFWMPTFRKSVIASISEKYEVSPTGLPIFFSVKEIDEFSQFLYKNNILLILKPHPLQAEMEVYSKQFSNIKIIKNEDLQEVDVQLYEFLRYSDVLISDYSSVSFDYMLMDKPIIYTLDDMKEYQDSRGLILGNGVLDYYAGYHICNKYELQNALLEINHGVDLYKQDRDRVKKLIFCSSDGNSSKRIVENTILANN